jgi:hypothetical protein
LVAATREWAGSLGRVLDDRRGIIDRGDAVVVFMQLHAQTAGIDRPIEQRVVAVSKPWGCRSSDCGDAP